MITNIDISDDKENTQEIKPLPSVTITHPKIERTESVDEPRLDLYDYTDGKLNVFTSQGLETLSVSPFISEVEVVADEARQGINYSIPALKMSPNGNFLYFCEQQTEKANYCVGYIYDYTSEAINPITINNNPFTIANDLASEVLWNENGLYLENIHSIDSIEPWLMNE